jgi:HAD superfamily hydrolase (TIGR01549 family)
VTKADRRYDALLLDAFGTLITVDAPAERLVRAVAEELGIEVTLDDAQRAFTAEIVYYAERCHLGRDPDSLAALHDECAAIVLAELDIDMAPRRAVELLGHAIQYRAYDDTAPLLRGAAAAGMPVAIVSNADYTLPDMLARAGVEIEPTRVFSSAATGSSKPDPGIFEHALARLGAPAGRALHVGDTPGTDAVGAQALGIDVRLIDRDGAYASERTDTVTSLTEILELIA